MARIPDGELERLKAEVSVLRLVEAAGIELKRHGKDWLGRCPFHDDKTPSLVVSPEKNLWHCLGRCNVGGTAIDWVMRMKGVSFRLAVELLREGLPTLAAKENSPAQPVKKNSTVKLSSDLTASADDQACLQRVVAYYHATLKQSPEALQYLQRRGLNHPELLETFKLGYANRTLAYRLPEKNRLEGAVLRTQLQQLGILRASGHEHFNGSLVIPICDAQGNVVQMYGRKLLDNLRAGTPKHLYLPGPHRGIFNLPALAASKDVILCEALIDALTFWCAGFRNVTASYGVNGFTDEHLAAFKQCGVQRVLIAYDRDDAGDSAAEALAPKLQAAGIECLRVQFPHGFDANGYALKVQPAEKSLGVALRGAQWMGAAQGRANGAGGRMPGAAAAQGSANGAGGRMPGAAQGKPSVLSRLSAPVESVADEVLRTPTAADTTALAYVYPVEPQNDTPSLAADSPHEPAASMAELPCAAPAVGAAPVLDAVPIEVRENEILILLGDRRWRIRGLVPEPTPGQLKVNLLVSREGCGLQGFHVDTLDLYAARLRAAYLKQAAVELAFSEDTLKRDLGAVLLKLEALQAEKASTKPATPQLTMTADEKAAAMTLLRDPKLIERIVGDLSACGIVGEDVNKLVCYLACISRKLASPLAVVIQSLSAAGKSALMDAVLDLVPEEERIHYSAMTGQSLFYLGEQDLKHKILAIAEEEGVRQAAYALKVLQSQGVLTIASTGKDPVSGKLVTQTYRVEGPVMLFLTTTATDLDEELSNRCLILTVNESREQTRAIHVQQREAETLQGVFADETKKHLHTVHRNAQRLLRPLKVVNPFAPQLTFLDDRTRTRRDHKKYLGLIRAIALLHQYQREVKTMQQDLCGAQPIEYIEATAADVQLANVLAHQVLGQSLDELTPQTRRLLQLLNTMVEHQCAAQQMSRPQVRFTRREVMDHTRFSYEQLRVHLERLVELEYVLVHRGSRGQSFCYELLWRGEGEDGARFVMGLTDPAAAQGTVAPETMTTTSTLGGEHPHVVGSLSPQWGVSGGRLLDDEIAPSPVKQGTSLPMAEQPSKRTSVDHPNGASHRSRAVATSSTLAAS